MAGDSACEHFRLGRFSMAETPVFQNATWGNVDAEERLEVDHLGLHLPPLPPGVPSEMDTLATVSRSTKPDGLARVAFSPKS